MTTVKLDSKIGGGPAATLEPLVPGLYAQPGIRILGVVELVHVERVQPAPDSDGEPVVKMRISALEIAGKQQEGALREAQRALHLHRTAMGTLDEHGQIVLTERTLKQTAGLLSEIQNATMRAALSHWGSYARSAAATVNISHSELLHELKAVADGLRAALGQADLGDD